MGIIDKVLAKLKGSNVVQPKAETTSENESIVASGPPLGGSYADAYYDYMDQFDRSRNAAYKDYDQMDNEVVIISRALDDHADLMTSVERGDLAPFEIACKDEKVKTILDDLNSRTKLLAKSWPISRNFIKMGDDFEEIVFNSEGNLIVRIKGLPTDTMERKEDEFGLLQDPAYIQNKDGKKIAEFKEFQIVHYRNDLDRSVKYGKSLLKAARRVWRQLQLMEDGMVIGRLVRSHLRYKFILPGGNLAYDDQKKLIETYQNLFRKKRVIDPRTGKPTVENALMTADEDFFVCTSEEAKADIGVLEGSRNLGEIRDVEYFQNGLFSKLEIPKAMLAFERDVNARATLHSEDVHLVRKINRRRGTLSAGLRQIYDTQLVLLDIDPVQADYELKFVVLRTEDELNRANADKAKAETGQIWQAMGVPLPFILVEFLDLTEEEITDMQAAVAQETEPLSAAEEWLTRRGLHEELKRFQDVVANYIAKGTPILIETNGRAHA